MLKNDFNQNIVFASATTKYSDPYQIDPAATKVDVVVNLSSISGVGASLVTTVQFSDDNVNWEDSVVFDAITGAARKSLTASEPKLYMRFKMVLSGTTPSASLALYALAREGGEAESFSEASEAGAGQGLVGKPSGGDFSTAYASATTITAGTLPDSATLTAADILSIVQINQTGSVVKTFTRDDKVISVSGGTITVQGASFASTDTFVIYTTIVRGLISAGADGMSNTASGTRVFARMAGYNGSTWDRIRAGVNAVVSSFTGFLNTLPYGKYNSTPPTLTDGQGVNLQVNARGELITAIPSLTPAVGELVGVASATQLPNVACRMVRFKAQYNNAGRVYIGIAGVTKADGATDTTTGWQLSAGEETPWLMVSNLNVLYRICDNTGDALTYIAMN